MDLLRPDEQPSGFQYPSEFLRICAIGLAGLEPWYLIEGDELRKCYKGLGFRFPTRHLVPFAKRQDNDDIACWENGRGKTVFIIHDFATPGWEERAQFDNVLFWFKAAIDDFINFV